MARARAQEHRAVSAAHVHAVGHPQAERARVELLGRVAVGHAEQEVSHAVLGDEARDARGRDELAVEVVERAAEHLVRVTPGIGEAHERRDAALGALFGARRRHATPAARSRADTSSSAVAIRRLPARVGEPGARGAVHRDPPAAHVHAEAEPGVALGPAAGASPISSVANARQGARSGLVNPR